MSELSSLCVYCGSSFGDSDVFKAEAEALGRACAEAGTRLVWGTLDIGSGRWQGSWVRAGGPVACPLALPPPPELVGEGFQFLQPLYVWGTFDVVWTEPEVAFEGSWGTCGVPLGVPWTGRAQGF